MLGSLFGSFLIVLCLFPAITIAQDARTYELRILGGPEAMTRIAQKSVHEYLVSIDLKSKISIQEDQLKVKVTDEIGSDQLLAGLNDLGVGTFEYLQPSTLPAHRIDTGDPPADDAAYHKAKLDWIEAHPELYKKLSGSEAGSIGISPPE